MTRVFEDIKRLEEAHARGEVSDDEVAALRRDILAMVEDADVLADDRPPAPARPMSPWRIAGLAGLGFVLAVALGGWLLGDLLLALTIAISIAALVLIRITQHLVEEEERPATPMLDETQPE